MSAFGDVYEALRSMMIAAAPHAVVAVDRPGDLVLHTTNADPKTGKPVWFGAVAVKARYVAYHLFPLYSDLGLGADLSPAPGGATAGEVLLQLRQGGARTVRRTRRVDAAGGRSDRVGKIGPG